MKRSFWCMLMTAGILGAASAHADSVSADVTLDANSPPTTQTAVVNGDAAATLGTRDRADASGGANRDAANDAANNLPGSGSGAEPHRVHARSWQSLLPGSIQ